jgi:phage repressor protein C with HTH and peptisase S24 domain
MRARSWAQRERAAAPAGAGVVVEEGADPLGDGEDPLADRERRQDVVVQVRGDLDP